MYTNNDREHEVTKNTYEIRDNNDNSYVSRLGVMVSGKYVTVKWIGRSAPCILGLYEVLVRVIYDNEYLLEKFRDAEVRGSWSIEEFTHGSFNFIPEVYNEFNYNASRKKLYVSCCNNLSGSKNIMDSWSIEEILVLMQFVLSRGLFSSNIYRVNKVSTDERRYFIASGKDILKNMGKELDAEEEYTEIVEAENIV